MRDDTHHHGRKTRVVSEQRNFNSNIRRKSNKNNKIIIIMPDTPVGKNSANDVCINSLYFHAYKQRRSWEKSENNEGKKKRKPIIGRV
jgi:hypothetical protein